MKDLIGKVALVTGGSRGMGAAIVKRFAAQGATVVLTYSRSSEAAEQVVAEIEQLGQKALAVAVDSAEPAAVMQVIEKTVADLGRLDILVNNAGVFTAKPIDALTLNDYEETMDVNVRAVFVACQTASAHMQPGGRIITIGSNLAERVPMPGASLYSMSKAALVGFTKGLARDLGSRGITANIVHPGSTDTAMNPADGEYAESQRDRMAIPQFCQPDDIAGLVTWLASDESRFVTGAGFTIDSGTNA